MWFLLEVKRLDLRIEAQVHFGWTLFLIVLLHMPFVGMFVSQVFWELLRWLWR